MLKFSGIEVQHLLKAWIAVSLAFGIVLNGGIGLDNKFLFSFVTAAITVGSGFLLHELAHKYFAQKYGCIAEFRAFDMMLILAVIMSFFGFIFAAPGAVFIGGKRISRQKNGIISVAGPALNIVLAILFLGMFYAAGASEMFRSIALYGFYINAWLGLFNMIPFFIFDGAKVWEWNKIAWGIVTVLAGGLMFAGQLLISAPL